jgi:hypothetical protein
MSVSVLGICLLVKFGTKGVKVPIQVNGRSANTPMFIGASSSHSATYHHKLDKFSTRLFAVSCHSASPSVLAQVHGFDASHSNRVVTAFPAVG